MTDVATRLDPSSTALLLIDMQNDFISRNGAYARAGLGNPSISGLPDRLAPVCQAMKAAGVMVLASRFTLWPDAQGLPMITAQLHRLRPFLSRGDFAAGSHGHSIVPALAPLVDACVDKIGFSAFLNTPLDQILRRAGISALFVAGFGTQGGVASTVRDALGQHFHTVLIADGCASLDPAAHQQALQDLAGLVETTHCASAMTRLR